jgi:hypothetical protein
VTDERATADVATPVAVGVLGAIPKQRPVEDPDGIDRLQHTMVVAALQLLAEQVRPGVEDARGELAEDEQLDLDLKEPLGRVARLHVDDGQFVVEGLALVVGVEDVDVRNRRGEIIGEQRVENVDQQVGMVVGPEQDLEDAVDLGIDGAVHTRSVLLGRGVDKVVTAAARAAPSPDQTPVVAFGRPALPAPVSTWNADRRVAGRRFRTDRRTMARRRVSPSTAGPAVP